MGIGQYQNYSIVITPDQNIREGLFPVTLSSGFMTIKFKLGFL